MTDRLAGRPTINDGVRLDTPGAFSNSLVMPIDGEYTLVAFARNSGKLDTTVTRRIFRDTTPPILALASPTGGWHPCRPT